MLLNNTRKFAYTIDRATNSTKREISVHKFCKIVKFVDCHHLLTFQLGYKVVTEWNILIMNNSDHQLLASAW